MSAGAIPNFDQWQPKKADGKVPDFDSWNSENLNKPLIPYNPNNPNSVNPNNPGPAREFMGTLLNDVGTAIPNLANTVKTLATTPPWKSVPEVVKGIGGGLIDLGRPSLWKQNPAKQAARITELAAPFALKGAGSLMEGVAPKLAETAMRVGKIDRIAGANPGRALMEETLAVRPRSIAADLGSKGASLGRDLERSAASSTTPGSLGPALQPILDRMQRAAGAGATTTAEQLEPMRSYFQGKAPQGFTGGTIPTSTGGSLIAPDQTASQLLQMRREFTPNFRIKYGPAADSSIQKVGRQAYRGLTDEVKRVVPGAADIDPRIHDMMAASDAAESTSRNAGLFQRTAGRMAAHTGALVGAGLGYQHGGFPGAVAGLVIPELAASPTAQMVAARGLQFGGKVLKAPSFTAPLTLAGRPKKEQ